MAQSVGGDDGPGRSGGPLIALHGVTKRFPGVVANDSVDLTLNKGEIHALIGENGAGKSTLMKVLYGLYFPDAGHIEVGGKEVRIPSPRAALGLGIGMVHQHFVLVDRFTVAENVILGDEGGPLVDLDRAAEKIEEQARNYGFTVEAGRRVEDLSVGEQQRVEILKA
ncbi:MAG TPA: ATP-binding cassette domain-containing protein, partial [Actinomycetota bacterium]|nr:ATP-binding cassette domain-containing protein [Actinomycetota bacterium]